MKVIKKFYTKEQKEVGGEVVWPESQTKIAGAAIDPVFNKMEVSGQSDLGNTNVHGDFTVGDLANSKFRIFYDEETETIQFLFEEV